MSRRWTMMKRRAELRTYRYFRILFLPESTEGISAGQTTAMTQDIVDYDKVDAIYSDGEENEEKTVQNS